MPGPINPVEESGVSTLQWGKHGVWLYGHKGQAKEWGDKWCSGAEGCQFAYVGDSRSEKVASLELEEPLHSSDFD